MIADPTIGADPVEASRQILRLTTVSDPPKILILGQDAFGAIRAHIEMLSKALKTSQQWSTDSA